MPGELIHIDVDPGVIGRNYPAEIAIVADAGDALDRTPPSCCRGGAADPGFVDRAREVGRRPISSSPARSADPTTGQIWQTIRRLLPPDAPIVRDSTVPAYLWGNRVLPVLRPRTSIRPVVAGHRSRGAAGGGRRVR